MRLLCSTIKVTALSVHSRFPHRSAFHTLPIPLKPRQPVVPPIHKRALSSSCTFAMPPKRKAPASTGYADNAGASANKRSACSKPAANTKPNTKHQTTLDSVRQTSPKSPLPPSDRDPAKSTAGSAVPNNDTSNKNNNSANGTNALSDRQFDHSRVEERYGIVQREFYPPEMSNERCAMYNNNEIPRPIEVLDKTIKETEEARSKIEVGEAVVHWFKRDLRLSDNRALHLAAKKAKEKNVPLVCMFIVSPQDYQAHLTSPARVDFELRTLKIMKDDLGKLDIPLYVITIDKRKRIPDHIIELCDRWGAKHVFSNIEYEVDELRREAMMTKKCLEKGIAFTAVHDDVVVAPGRLSTGQGKQYAVYSPWFRAWIAHVHSHPDLLDPFEPPGQNPESARQKFKDVFKMEIPEAPPNKRLSNEEKKRFEQLWPAGEHEASERLDRFLNEKVGRYKDTRNFPAENSTAMISVHHSAGTLAARTSVRRARDVNSTKKLDGGNPGIAGWISEVAWRDFYKHVLAHWPYVW